MWTDGVELLGRRRSFLDSGDAEEEEEEKEEEEEFA